MNPTARASKTLPRRDRGFTLVELMVVIVILGGLIAIVGTNVFSASKKADIGIAKTQMSMMTDSVKLYYLNNKKLPSTLDVLTEVDPKTGEALMENIPSDPWGNAYDYRTLSGRKFEIHSYGPDGIEGTEDDIVWPEPTE